MTPEQIRAIQADTTARFIAARVIDPSHDRLACRVAGISLEELWAAKRRVAEGARPAEVPTRVAPQPATVREAVLAGIPDSPVQLMKRSQVPDPPRLNNRITPPVHGERNTYVEGCRCERCKQANGEYQRRYRQERKESGEKVVAAWARVITVKMRAERAACSVCKEEIREGEEVGAVVCIGCAQTKVAEA